MDTPAAPAALTFPETGLMRMKDVLKVVPISRITLWRWSKAGKFPRPLRPSRTPLWLVSEVRAWLAANPFRNEPETQTQ